MGPGSSGQPADDQGRYQLEDLIDWDITLVRWIDGAEGESTPLSLAVEPWEVCASVPSVALRPYASEYEG